MKRNWTTKLLWFVLGIIVACVFSMIVPAQSAPTQGFESQFDLLKARVSALEEHEKNCLCVEAPDSTKHGDRR